MKLTCIMLQHDTTVHVESPLEWNGRTQNSEYKTVFCTAVQGIFIPLYSLTNQSVLKSEQTQASEPLGRYFDTVFALFSLISWMKVSNLWSSAVDLRSSSSRKRETMPSTGEIDPGSWEGRKTHSCRILCWKVVIRTLPIIYLWSWIAICDEPHHWRGRGYDCFFGH